MTRAIWAHQVIERLRRGGRPKIKIPQMLDRSKDEAAPQLHYPFDDGDAASRDPFTKDMLLDDLGLPSASGPEPNLSCLGRAPSVCVASASPGTGTGFESRLQDQGLGEAALRDYIENGEAGEGRHNDKAGEGRHNDKAGEGRSSAVCDQSTWSRQRVDIDDTATGDGALQVTSEKQIRQNQSQLNSEYVEAGCRAQDPQLSIEPARGSMTHTRLQATAGRSNISAKHTIELNNGNDASKTDIGSPTHTVIAASAPRRAPP